MIINRLRSPRLWWTLFATWLLTVYVLSSVPGDRFHATDIPYADKIVHVLIFLTGSSLLTLALRTGTAWSSAKIALLTFIALLAFGALDEFHQTFTPHRSGADLGDLIADAIGTFVGITLALLIHAQLKKCHRQKANLGTPSPDPTA